MKFLDTNVVLRYVLADDPKKAQRCGSLMARLADGQEEVAMHVLAVAEMVWVLTSVYELPKERVADVLSEVLSLEGVQMQDKDRVLSALGAWRGVPVDFIDAYHAGLIRDRKLKGVYSYDEDFDKLGVERTEP